MLFKENGFSLIEILVVSVVMGAIITVGMSNMRRFEEKQRTVQAADSFVTELRGVQKMADAGEKPSTGCSGELVGYRVDISSGSDVATVKAQCGADIEVKTITLRGGATFNATTWILFRALAQGVNFDGGGPSHTVQLNGSGGSYTAPISIGSGGTIGVGTIY
jgi:prepilin-type N-terminal cleavage/methylation domain-containing protein